MGRVRRNWTAEEDNMLRRAVQQGQSRPLLWRELAKEVPGRSNKDCRRRWWNSLAEGVKRGPWSEQEDAKLIAAVQQHGTNWSQVACLVGSRNSDQCASHWNQVLDPDINFCDWVQNEDESLLHAVLTHGTNWAAIASSHTPKRTTLALKNRYSALRLKHDNRIAKASRQNPIRGSEASQVFGQHEDYDDADDTASGITEMNESDNEDSSDYLDTTGLVVDHDRMITREVDKASIEPSLEQPDGASKAGAGEIVYSSLLQQPSDSVSMENLMTGLFGATESGTWGARDFVFAPGGQEAEFLRTSDSQGFAGMITPPATAIEPREPPQDFPPVWEAANHPNSPRGIPGGSYQLSFEMICSSEQLGDIISTVVSANKCVSVRITPNRRREE